MVVKRTTAYALTISQATLAIGCSTGRVRQLLENGKIARVKIGRHTYIGGQSVFDYLKRHGIDAERADAGAIWANDD